MRGIRALGFAVVAIFLFAAAPAWPQPVPEVSIDGSGTSVPIGETATFTVKFSNSGGKPGFGPYLALCLPAPGADANSQGGQCDGVTFVSAKAVFTGQTISLPPANPPTIHSAPGAPVVCSGLAEGSTNPLCGSSFPLPPGFEGCQIVFVELPFGSFYPEQPEVSIEIEIQASKLADVGTALPIKVVGGFRFGDSPTGTQCQEGTAADGEVTPTLFEVKKSYLGPEGETATGPNFPRKYRIDADVATGQTLTPLQVVEKLPDSLVYLGPYGPPVVSAPPPGTAGGTLVLDFGAVTGGPGPDASFTFDFHAGKSDAGGQPVLDPATCKGVAIDDIRGEAGWTPLDVPRDPVQTVTSDTTPEDHKLELECVAVQKSIEGPNPARAGDFLTYHLDAQVSDFVRARQLVLTDVLSDGLFFLANPAPTVRVEDQNGVVLGTFVLGQDATADLSAKPPHCGDGATTLTFDVAKALAHLGTHPAHKAGEITGGELPPNPPSVAATVRLTYQVRVQDRFDCPVPSGDRSVDKDDHLPNRVAVGAAVRGLRPRAAVTPAMDDSQAEVEIAGGTAVKDVVARNGNTNDPALQQSPPHIAPGDTVTFRLRYLMPASDAEQFVLEDFLPAPVFAVQSMVFVPCPFGGPPAAGQACWGPADQIHFILGSPVKPCRNLADFADPSRNSVCFDLGSFDDKKNKPRLIEILFTVTATDDPFADGLQLTNQVLESEQNSFDEQFSQTGILQLTLGQPDVRVTKGAVSTCCAAGASCKRNTRCKQVARLVPPTPGPVAFGSPSSSCAKRFTPALTSAGLATTPVASDAVGSLEPGDRVLYAVVVENRGSSPNGAFDVRVQDVLPPGMRIPDCGIALCVADGAGQPLPFKDLGGGLLGAGIELVDPAQLQGALGPGKPADPKGGNLAVVTYVLEVGPDLAVGACAENRAALASYAGTEGGASHVAAGLGGPAKDGARACRRPRLTKEVAATSEDHTSFKNGAEELAIGEIVRFRITFEVPRGKWPHAVLLDPPPPPPLPVLPAGLRLLPDTVRLAFVASQAGGLTATGVAGPGLFVAGNETTVASITPTFIPPPAVNASTAQRLDLRLGDLENSEPDCDREFVVVEMNVLVENVAANQDGRELENRAFAGADGLALTSGPVRLRVVEPLVQVGNACPEGRFAPSKIVNRGSTDAYDLILTDTIPLPFCDTPPNVTVSPLGSGTATVAGQKVTVVIPHLPAGGLVVVDTGALCAGVVNPPQCIVNVAEVTSTTLPGPKGTPANPTGSQPPGASGAANGERGYLDRGACNLPGGADCLANLALDKTCSPGTPPVCTVQVTNLGPAAAGTTTTFPTIVNESTFTIDDLLPPGAKLVGASGLGWSCTGTMGTVSCRYDDPVTFSLAPGEPAPPLVLRIDTGGAPSALNCAQVALEPPVLDLQPGNDTDCAPVP